MINKLYCILYEYNAYFIPYVCTCACEDPEKGGPELKPLENHSTIVSLGILVHTQWEITKLSSQHSMLDHHRPANETPLKWCFVGGAMMARF